HDADNPIGRASNRQRLLQNSCIAAESALPHFVTQDDDLRAAGAVFSWREYAPDLRTLAENIKEVRRNPAAVNLFRFSSQIDTESPSTAESRKTVKDVVLFL